MSLVQQICKRCLIGRVGLNLTDLSAIGVTINMKIPGRFASTKEKFEPGKPRTLLELYEKNPSWLSKQRQGRNKGALETGIQQATKPLETVEDNTRIGPIVSKPFPIILAEEKEWGKRSLRPGLVGTKLGMTTMWTKSGQAQAVTLVQIKECQVVKVHVGHQDGGAEPGTYIEVGGVDQKELSKVPESKFAMYLENGVNPKKFLKAFKVTADGLLPAGTKLHAAHFRPGQRLKVTSISQTKGFQGVMKRWGMKGMPASHGVSKSHRKMGASGGGGDPGRVFPGKKMAGHMGGNRVCLKALKVLRINTKYNVLYIKGQIAGHNGDWVKLADSDGQNDKTGLPFPTYFPDEESPLPEDLYEENIQPYSEASLVFDENSS